jgi:hypothetical protein
MKKLFCVVFFLLIFSFASASFAADPAVRTAGLAFQAQTFDQLLKQTVVTLDAAAAITASDNVSTGTEAVYMLPDTVEYPVKLRIQNHGTASLTYVPYSTSVASGIVLPTATASHLLTPEGAAVVSGKAFEGVFFRAPNISIGASGDQEVIIEVWGRKGTE